MLELQTALTKRLNIRHPALLAPMAGVSGGAMAAAVAEAIDMLSGRSTYTLAGSS